MPSEPFDTGADLLKEYSWSGSSQAMLQELLDMRVRLHQKNPDETAPLTPEIVMLGILKFGQQRVNSEHYLAGKLAAIIGTSMSRLDRLLSEEFGKAVAAQKFSPTNKAFTPDLAGIFRLANAYCGKTSIQGKISLRHLIASLLSPQSQNDRVGSRFHLPNDVNRPEEFAQALVEHINTSSNVKGQDRRENWNSIIESLQPSRGADGNPPKQQARSLADAEDDLSRQIDELKKRQATTKNADERAQIENAIHGLLAGLETVQAEKGTQLGTARPQTSQTSDSITAALSKWSFSTSCNNTLSDLVSRCKYFQIQSSNRIIPLTPEMVMLMLLIRGCPLKGNPYDLAAVIAKAFSLTEKVLEHVLTEKLANPPNAGNASGSIISPQLEEVFNFAENISRKVSAKAVISQRHLIAGLLYGNTHSQISKSGMDLPTSIFRPSELVWELEKYVKSSPTVRTKELAQEWERVIAEIRHGITFPEDAVRLASEIRALEKRGVDTTDQAERVRIKAELDRKHAELDTVLGQKGTEPPPDPGKVVRDAMGKMFGNPVESIAADSPLGKALSDNPPTEEVLSNLGKDAEFISKGESFNFTVLQLCEKRFADLRARWKFSTSMLSVVDELRTRLSKGWLEESDQQVSPAAMGLAVIIRAADDSAWPEDLFKSIRAKTPVGRDHLISLLTEELKRNQSQTPTAPKVFSDSLILILEDAERMADTISNDKILGVRHALCALFRNEATVLALLRFGLPVGAFITSLHEHIADGTMVEGVDKRELWSPELKKVAEVLTTTESTRAKEERGQSRTGTLKFGAEDSFIREASSKQSCMKVEKYADALRDFFCNAGSGELCFALYGHWGRGKTYLMKMVRDALVEKEYETVFFSAWKYPGTPEVWVHLYETIANQATRVNLFKALPRIVRSGISKNGPWPLIFALAALVFGLIPKIYLTEHLYTWVKALLGFLGLGGVIWVGEFMFDIRKTAKRLSHDFLTTRHHTEKLGLQATIGEDLESVLVGWMPQGNFKFGWAAIAYFALVTVFTWSAWHWFGFLSGLTDFLGRHPVLHYFFDLKSHPNLQLCFTIAAAVLGVGLFVWVFAGFWSPKRILLVIDDLDRCKPDQLLSVVESIKLLLEDIEISKRVQVAMLVEEDILRQAVRKKYMIELGLAEIKKFDEKRILDENLEKLFTTHLRLPPLSEEDFREDFRKILNLNEEKFNEIVKKNQTATKTQSVQISPLFPKDAPDAPSSSKADPANADRADLAASAALTPAPSAPPAPVRATDVKPIEAPLSEPPESTWETGFEFSDLEKEAFIVIVPLLREMNLPWGPRSIRAFTFRYKLTRLILKRIVGEKKMPPPSEILTELAKAMNRDRADDKYDSEVLKIIHQVS